MKRKALIKRLKKENKNLMREVKKSVKRKLVSESDEYDSDDSYSSENAMSPKRRRDTHTSPQPSTNLENSPRKVTYVFRRP